METDGQAPDENSQVRPEDVALIERALIAIRHDQNRRHLQQHHAEWLAEHGDGSGGSGGADGSGDRHGGGHGAGHVGPPWQAGAAWAGRGGPGMHGFGPGGPGFPGHGSGHRGRRDGSLGRAARYRMLEALEAAERDGRSLTISMIGEAIGVDQPRASRLVQEASEAGLVRRTTDPTDARRSIVELTTAGRTQISDVRSARRSAVEDALAAFTPEEAHAFAELFSRFVTAWPRD